MQHLPTRFAHLCTVLTSEARAYLRENDAREREALRPREVRLRAQRRGAERVGAEALHRELELGDDLRIAR